jgi:uroporphyrinogen III methyltransferase/synthase
MPTVILTSPQPNNDRLASMLKQGGVTVWQMPLLQYAPPQDDFAALDQSIRDLAVYQYVVFTSAQAVRVFQERVARQGTVPLAHLKVAAVGEATATLCAEYGLPVHHISEKASGKALAQMLKVHVSPGNLILFPQAEVGRAEFAEEMRDAGVRVDSVVAYRSMPTSVDVPAWTQRLKMTPWDGLVVTSPRCLRQFLDLFGHAWAHEVLQGRTVFGLGSTTREAAERLGFRKAQIPAHSTLEALTELLLFFYYGG